MLSEFLQLVSIEMINCLLFRGPGVGTFHSSPFVNPIVSLAKIELSEDVVIDKWEKSWSIETNLYPCEKNMISLWGLIKSSVSLSIYLLLLWRKWCMKYCKTVTRALITTLIFSQYTVTRLQTYIFRRLAHPFKHKCIVVYSDIARINNDAHICKVMDCKVFNLSLLEIIFFFLRGDVLQGCLTSPVKTTKGLKPIRSSAEFQREKNKKMSRKLSFGDKDQWAPSKRSRRPFTPGDHVWIVRGGYNLSLGMTQVPYRGHVTAHVIYMTAKWSNSAEDNAEQKANF